jgi:pimeloyl-ACP methyl ester carboxylesterase
MNPPVPVTERHIPGLSATLRRRLRWLFRLLAVISPSLAAGVALRLFLTPFARRISEDEARFLATATSLELPTPQGSIHAYEWPGTGPTILVVHGWISNAARMGDVIRVLLARGLRVVAFDAPAHGRSGGSRVDLHGFRGAIAAVDRRFGPFHGVLAHSFGALTAASWLAEEEPASIRAAVLVGLPSELGYLFDSYTLAMQLRADIVQHLRDRFRARYGAYPEEYSARQLAARIHVPVLLVHGGADELVPAAHALAVDEQLIDGEVLVLEGMKHSAPLRDPAAIARMADFLEQRVGGG